MRCPRSSIKEPANCLARGPPPPPPAGIARFLRHPGFPVDIRHNAKIGRETLAVWAAQRA
ncbi:hypothetical protein [Xanthomonas vesicatoria]|uniref:hypothetical protein n=1 Tax=Xanthomonas vesicatoria TaxID=56460 RepID=UPI0009B63F7F|nr:hypothetical protein [Xanthomonas vesicatoria]